MYGEQGISVHITANNEEILIGAPGIFTWKGSVVRYRSRPIDDFGGLSRRAENSVTIPRHRRQNNNNNKDDIEYYSEIPNPVFWEQEDNSYFGFAVSSGFFDGHDNPKMLYVASAPQANLQQGEVCISIWLYLFLLRCLCVMTDSSIIQSDNFFMFELCHLNSRNIWRNNDFTPKKKHLDS